MLNGQLKSAYNVQIEVEDYFIIYGYVSNDYTDYNILIKEISISYGESDVSKVLILRRIYLFFSKGV